jgi:N-acetylglutamate synthase-like GNAT family acetyltransferase
MIRLANKYDLDACVEMMRQYSFESGIDALSNTTAHNSEYVSNLLLSLILGRGFIFIDDQHRGMIAGIITPNIWCNSVMELRELAWWIHPDFRNKTIGGKLFLAFNKKADELTKQNRVKLVYMSLMKNSTVQSLPGYKMIDSTFLKV